MDTRYRLRVAFTGLVASFLLASPCTVSHLGAQVTTATIEGTVSDVTKSSLPGATVTITNVETTVARTTVADENGHYVASNLIAGTYEVKGELNGFRTVVRQGIVLTIGRQAVVDLALEVGSVEDKIVVVGEASLVNTATGGLSGVTDGTTIRELPINGRDFLRLTLLESGTVPVTYRKELSRGFGMQVSLNGARPEQTGYLLDGTDIKNSTSFHAPGSAAGVMLGVDAIREFEVLSNGFSAEYGNAAGGIVNAVTRSGTNEYRGSVFEFHRNDALDSKNYFDTDKPSFTRNQFGGTLGGPILRGRTFFFANYEGFREDLGLTTLMTVPNEAARRGVLPSGNVQVNPEVVPYFSLWPLPNGRDFGDGTGEYSFVQAYPTHENYFISRVDHRIGNQDQVYVRYSLDDASTITPKGAFANPNFGVSADTHTQYVTAEHTKVLGARTVNSLRMSYNISKRTGVDALLRDVDPALKFLPGEVFGTMRIPGITDPGPDGKFPDNTEFDVFEIQEQANLTRGRHSLKAGLQWNHYREKSHNDTRPGGEYRFRSLADFLAGKSDRLRAPGIGSDSQRTWLTNVIGLFVQDNIELGSRLTLNLGVRYEFMTVPTEKDGKVANLRDVDHDTANTVGDPLFLNPSLKNIAPRLGFAWNPFGDGKTSVRGGFGVYYEQLALQQIKGPGNRNSPFYFDTNVRNPLFPDAYASLTELPPSQVLEAPNPVQYDANQPTLYHYTVSVQREVLPKTVLTLAYAGSRGKNLQRMIEYNNVVPEVLSDGRLFFPPDSERRNPAFDTIDLKVQDGHSFYNSGQVKLSRRLSSGFLLNTTYTLAKVVDDSSSGFGASDYGYPTEIPNWYGPTSWRGLANFDVRHTLNVSANYELPAFDNLKGVASTLLNGWQVGGILALRSGTPFTAKLAVDQAGTLGKTDTQAPNLIAGSNNNPIRPGNPDQYFDPSVFSLPEAGFFGDLGRNTLIGPGLSTVDLSLFKNNRLSDHSNIQLRFEVFNLFNRANFANPLDNIYVLDADGPINSAGRITATATTARQVQLGVKFLF